jgi:hypothetical protein
MTAITVLLSLILVMLILVTMILGNIYTALRSPDACRQATVHRMTRRS